MLLKKNDLRFWRRGCDDVIRKPYRDTEIFDALAKHLGVRFLYADDDKPFAAVQPGLEVSALARLAPDLLRDLKQAAELLDEQLCLQVIERIDSSEHALRERLYNIGGRCAVPGIVAATGFHRE